MVAVLAMATLLGAAPARAVLLDVTVDTSALGGASSILDFILTNTNAAANDATISGFTTDGTLGAVVAALTTPDVTGTLPGTVNLPDTVFLWEEYAHDITLGSILDFTIAISANFIGGLPADGLSFALLSPGSLLPVVMTSDPTGADALFAIMSQQDGAGNRVDVQIYDIIGANDPRIPVSISIRQPRGDAPEPATVALLGFILILLPLMRRQRPVRPALRRAMLRHTRRR